MEQVSMVAADVLLSKRVQEMVLNGEEPPPPYVCRDDGSVQCVPSNLCSLPVIDFEPFTVISQTPNTKQKQELEKLQSALSSWGCFQVLCPLTSSPFSILSSLKYHIFMLLRW